MNFLASLPCLRVMDMLILLHVLELLQSHRLLSVNQLAFTSTKCERPVKIWKYTF